MTTLSGASQRDGDYTFGAWDEWQRLVDDRTERQSRLALAGLASDAIVGDPDASDIDARSRASEASSRANASRRRCRQRKAALLAEDVGHD